VSFRLLQRGTKHQKNAPILYLPSVTTGVKWLTKRGDKRTVGRHFDGAQDARITPPKARATEPPPTLRQRSRHGSNLIAYGETEPARRARHHHQ
jgi:hypothetical protein